MSQNNNSPYTPKNSGPALVRVPASTGGGLSYVELGYCDD